MKALLTRINNRHGSSTEQKKSSGVGGGFAGINFIKKMGNTDDFDITLVDVNNYHFFPPLLYQVATAFIEASNITYPFRRMFQGKHNTRFHLGSCAHKYTPKIKPLKPIPALLNTITGAGRRYRDRTFLGWKMYKRAALPMKTIDDALNMRNHILLNLEKAVRTNDMAEREKLLTVVIAGGGPTGVEMAGMLAEMGQHIIKKEYPEFVDLKSRIYLVDAGPVVLAPMSKKAQDEAYKVLQDLGVNIILNTPVKDYVDGKVMLANGETIATQALIWASGVTGQVVNGLPAESIARGRRIVVDEFNAVKGVSDIYALGDICLQTTDPAFPNGHPQLAQVAIQQGQLLAANLKKKCTRRNLKTFSL